MQFTVEDAECYQAVFAEQQAPAVKIATARLESLAYREWQETRHDAQSACKPVVYVGSQWTSGFARKVCPQVCRRWPLSRKHNKNGSNIPVVPLERHLYGHPLTWRLRESKLQEELLKLLFLSIKVDELNKAGKERNLRPMWRNRKTIDVERTHSIIGPSVPWMHSTRSRGRPRNRSHAKKSELFRRTLTTEIHKRDASSTPRA